MNLPLVRLTCVTGIAECEIPKARLTRVFFALDSVDAEEEP